MTFPHPEFCPFCGKRSLTDQGGSDEVMQLECVNALCGIFFNLQRLEGPFLQSFEREE